MRKWLVGLVIIGVGLGVYSILHERKLAEDAQTAEIYKNWRLAP